MKQFVLLACIIAGSVFFLTGNGCFSGKSRSADPLLRKLKTQREKDEYYYITHGDDLILFVKVPGVDTLIGVLDTLQQINGHKVLDSTEYSYDVLKNANGKLIYINRLSSIKSPYSLHIYVHYFDEQGSTYAFQKKEVMFFDGDNPKLVMDDHVVYYDKDFRVIGETDTVKNTDHKIINLTTDERKKMAFKYDSYRNLTSCLKGYRIRLKN